MSCDAFPPPRQRISPHWAVGFLLGLLPLFGSLTGTTVAHGGDQPLSRQITLDFDPSRVEILHDEQTGFDRIKYPHLSEFKPMDWVGAPALPAVRHHVLLPDGFRVAGIEVQLSAPVLIPGHIRPIPIEDEQGGAALPDPAHYDGQNLFPPVTHHLMANSAYRSLRMAEFVVMPFEYLGNVQALRIYRRAEVRVRFEPVSEDDGLPRRLRPDRQFSRGRYELDWIRRNVANPEDLDAFYPTHGSLVKSVVADTSHSTGFYPTDRPSILGPPVDMVIVTGTEWVDGQDMAGDMTVPFQRLADWRTRSGIPTVVRTVQWIRENYAGVDDPTRIRAFLKDAYSKWGTDFALLGGAVEVVPTRMVYGYQTHTQEDPPCDYYYVGLDGDWNPDLNEYYTWSEFNSGVDAYPDLWVGRIPARDSLEAERIVDKLFAYERVPGTGFSAPPDSFYTKGLIAAGLTNNGSWGSWSNGIYVAEQLKRAVFDSTGFAVHRLYPNLGDSESCGGIYVLECYGDIKDSIPGYAQIEKFTASNLRTRLNTEKASVFFHMEHSSYAQLGGPYIDRQDTNKPSSAYCSVSDCPNCPQWRDDCYASYRNSNPKGGISREVAADLENGPAYFVGVSFGSHVGRFERHSIACSMVRAPNGGAVAFFAKSLSYGNHGSSIDQRVEIQALKYLMREKAPLGVALHQGVQDQYGNRGRVSWHCFGDPTMHAWSGVPEPLAVSCNYEKLPVEGIWAFTISVEDQSTLPIEGARVTLSRDNDIYAIGETNSNGQARFPAVLVPHIADTMDVVCTLPGALPAVLRIPPPQNRPPGAREAPLVYVRHEHSDSLQPGPTAGVIDAGDRIDLNVVVKNLGTRTSLPGEAWITATPRVKGTALIDNVFDANRIYIGRGRANPPAFADTFCLLVNEYGIRPELPPPSTPDSTAWYLWRGLDGRYHTRAVYGSNDDPGIPYRALFVADGGLAVCDSVNTETGDEWGISSGGDSLWISFIKGGPGDLMDELIWRAQAEDWISFLVASVAVDSVGKKETTVLPFRFDVDPDIPPRTRLDFTVSTKEDQDPFPVFTDFFVNLRAPDVSLGVVEPAMEDTLRYQYACLDGAIRYAFPVWVRNIGDGAVDSVRCRVKLSGSNVTPHVTSTWFALGPGEENISETPLVFCDKDYTCVIDTLELAYWVNGEKKIAKVLTDVDPWPIEGIDLDFRPRDSRTYPEQQGVRLVWNAPYDTTDVWGYSVWVEADSVAERRMMLPRTAVRHVHLNNIPFGKDGEAVAYRIGVSSVLRTHRETSPTWTGWVHPNMDLRQGWPRKMPLSGMANSVALVDFDDDGTLEVVAAGRVLAAWKEDGSSATAHDSGLLFDPIPALSGSTRHFYGHVAAGDLCGDGNIRIAAVFGNKRLYVVNTDGTLAWYKYTVESGSTVTLADLDGNGCLEVIVPSLFEGSIYVFRCDGTGYRNTDGLFVNHDSARSWWYAGVAVAQWGESDTLSIVQSTIDGRVYAWKANTGGSGNPPFHWYRYGVGKRVSTPTVADFNRDGTQDVLVTSSRDTPDSSYVTVLSGVDGSILRRWRKAGHIFDGGLPQVPIAVEMGNDDSPAVLVGRKSAIRDSTVLVMVLYEDDQGNALDDACEVTIPMPGRSGYDRVETLDSPLVVDIDGDGKLEVMIGANQGGLYVWEVEWDEQAEEWSAIPKSGWPMVFPDQVLGMAVGDLDNDGFLELVVPLGDGYVYVYDLPGLSTGNEPWPMVAHDVRRTGNALGGGTGRLRPAPESDYPGESHLALVGRHPALETITVSYRVPGRTRVEVGIYDVQGRLVRNLVPASEQDRGVYTEVWKGRSDEGRRVPSGVYFIKAEIGKSRLTKKVVLAR